MDLILENWRQYLNEAENYVPRPTDNVTIVLKQYSDAYLDRFTLREIKTEGFDKLLKEMDKLLSGNKTVTDLKTATEHFINYVPRLINSVGNKMLVNQIQDRLGRWDNFKTEIKWILKDLEVLKNSEYTDKTWAEQIRIDLEKDVKFALNSAFVGIAPPEIR